MLILGMIFALATKADAVLDDPVDTAALTDQLPDEAAEILRDVSPTDPAAVREGLLRTAESALQKIEQAAASVLKTAGVLLIVCVSVALAETLGVDSRAPEYVMLSGVTAIGTAALSDFDSCLNVGLDSLRGMQEFSKALLPVLASTAAMTGSAGGAAVKYSATALFMDVLLECASGFIVPCVCGYAALSIADAAVGNNTLKAAKKLIKSVCTTLLTALCTAYTAWLAFSGVISGTADAMTTRMAKTAVSTALPVVGSILSDAAGALAAAAGLLRGSIGLFGAAAVLCVCISPFALLGARYLAYKLSAGLCGCVADARLTALVNDLGTCFGLVLALNGAGVLMMFVSIFSLIRTAL